MDGDRKSFSVPGHTPGLKCGACDAALGDVTKIQKTPGLIIRDRRCPVCGESNKTLERVISTEPVRRYFRG